MSRTIKNFSNFTLYMGHNSNSIAPNNDVTITFSDIVEINSGENTVLTDTTGNYIPCIKESDIDGLFSIKYATGDDITSKTDITNDCNYTGRIYYYNNERYIGAINIYPASTETTVNFDVNNTASFNNVLNNITYTAENVTAKSLIYKFILNLPYRVNITWRIHCYPNSGYIFTSDYNMKAVLTYNYSGDTSDERVLTSTITPVENSTDITFTFAIQGGTVRASYITNINIQGTVIQGTSTANYTVGTTLSNCTLSYNPTNIGANTEVTFILTSNNGFSFTNDNIPTLTVDDASHSFTLSDDLKTATLSITTGNSGGTINVVGTASTTTEEKKIFTLRDDNVTNAVLTYTPSTIYRTEPFTAILTANNGYIFSSDNIPTLRIGGFDVASFTLSNDLKTATLTYTPSDDDISGNVFATAVLSGEVITSGYDFINVLHITSDNLKELSKTRFVSSESGIIDYGDFIVSLKRFYCDIPLSGVNMDIALGTLNTGVSADIIKGNRIILDCGNVTIESTNNNENDYNNTIKMIIPFVGNITIDANIIMNREINLSYEISIITGDLVATVKDVKTNIILAQFTGNIAETIPYTLNNIASEIKGGFITQSGLLYGFIPKIIIMYHDNYNDNTYYNDDKRGMLSAVASGLCEIDNVIINDLSLINNDEYDLIINELARGVIFD